MLRLENRTGSYLVQSGGYLITRSDIQSVPISEAIRSKRAELEWTPPERIGKKCFERIRSPKCGRLLMDVSGSGSRSRRSGVARGRLRLRCFWSRRSGFPRRSGNDQWRFLGMNHRDATKQKRAAASGSQNKTRFLSVFRKKRLCFY